jgi:hypothetical protein
MTSEQIKALIQMLATLAITLCGIFGYSLAENEAQAAAVVIAAVVVIAYSVWRNCNLTSEAGTSQKILDGLKDKSIDVSAVEAFLGVANDGVHVDGKEFQDDRE